jgi:hypothetical protein
MKSATSAVNSVALSGAKRCATATPYL